MDTGKFENNTTFYDGYESETEITLYILQKIEYNIHIYEGYFFDFFGDPALDGKRWNGFTRDYNQMERTFGEDDYVIKDGKAYLDDLLLYKDKEYKYPETKKCYLLLRDFLTYAVENEFEILVHVF